MRKRDEEAPPESDAFAGAPHPRLATEFIGNSEAEQSLLATYKSGRLPHCWILGGPEGVGKATLAWRFTRFLFAYPNSSAPQVQRAATLYVPANNPIYGKIAGLGLGDLCVLRREWNTKAKPARHFTEIRVDDVRAASHMFQLASSVGGWRICIIDCADDLNKSSANALLKLIEEPPPRSLFLFIAQQPGRVLQTIRSRSRLLSLQSLDVADVERAVVSLGSPWSDRGADIGHASELAKGSVRRALRLLDGDRLIFEKRLAGVLNGLPKLDWLGIHSIADKVWLNAGLEDYEATIAAIFEWLGARARACAHLPPARLARYAEAWEKVSDAVRETEALNLDKRPLILSIFADLAAAEQAARR